MLSLVDNNGNIVSTVVSAPVNNHDSALFPESLSNFLDTSDLLGLDINESYLTLDSGFDSEHNHTIIREANLKPVIKPNLRGLKNRTKINTRLDRFETIESIYKQRHNVERSFAFEDTYRKLVIRYERLKATFLGFRYLAYSLINFRWIFRAT